MILQGNQRGGATDLANHLASPENEIAEVYSLDGFAADDLHDALREAQAISRGTRCKQFLYSLSLNPPPDAQVETRVFEAAIERIEDELGLKGQPRAIIFHEKEGANGRTRRHAHVVWSRIKVDEMKAIPLPFTKRKLQNISRDLFIEYEWKMPSGFIDQEQRSMKNFTLAEWQQAKRIGKDPRVIKKTFQDAWAASDSRAAFANALEERGYKLARGDKRGFVGVDGRGEVYSVPKMSGIKTKLVREQLGNEQALPSVAEVKHQIASGMLPKLKNFERELSESRRQALLELKECKGVLVECQKVERKALHERQEARCAENARQRQARFRKGLKGLWDRLTGVHQRTEAQNMRQAQASQDSDKREKDRLIFRQIDQRSRLKVRFFEQRQNFFKQRADLRSDIELYRRMKLSANPTAEAKSAFRIQRNRQHTARKHLKPRQGPKLE